jgi:hypothetical protein
MAWSGWHWVRRRALAQLMARVRVKEENPREAVAHPAGGAERCGDRAS